MTQTRISVQCITYGKAVLLAGLDSSLVSVLLTKLKQPHLVFLFPWFLLSASSLPSPRSPDQLRFSLKRAEFFPFLCLQRRVVGQGEGGGKLPGGLPLTKHGLPQRELMGPLPSNSHTAQSLIPQTITTVPQRKSPGPTDSAPGSSLWR